MGAAPREVWHICVLSERVLRQSASVTSQLSDIVRVGRLTERALCFRGSLTMDCVQSTSFAKTLECYSRVAHLCQVSKLAVLRARGRSFVAEK